MSVRAAVLAGGLLIVACSNEPQVLGTGSTGSGASGGGGSEPMGDPLPCALDALLASRCRQCHGPEPGLGATRSLLFWEDLVFGPFDGYDTIGDACLARMELPADDEERMPLQPQQPASIDEIAVVSDWIDAGMRPRDAMETCE